jgi:pimeloyl-ACP methyl ester carboxylesterase
MERAIDLRTGVTLRYVERGDPRGTPVVFLHGVTDSWRSFETVLGLLPDDVHAYALTQRGHARSSQPAEGYLYSHLSDDLHAFMDAQRLASAFIVGHSMGSMVAQRFAIDHPERVAGLVLVGAFADLQHNDGVAEYYRAVISGLADPVDRAIAHEFQVSTIGRPLAPAQLETFVDESVQVPAHAWRALFRGFVETPSMVADLARVSVPTLLLRGGLDTYALDDDLQRLRRGIPHAVAKTYEGVGHAVHWEVPEEFTGDLVRFIRDAVSRR